MFEILDYWKERTGDTKYSEKLYKFFKANLATISKHPAIGKQSGYKGVRVKIAGNYLLFYKILRTEIQLITIWDSRQNPDRLQDVLSKS